MSKRFTVVNMHGCRSRSDTFVLPDNVWVISPCEEEPIWTKKEDFDGLVKFKNKLEELQGVHSYNLSHPSPPQNQQYQEALDIILRKGKVGGERNKNYKYKKYFCVTCPGKELYNMTFSHDKKVGKDGWKEKYGLASGIYYWFINFSNIVSIWENPWTLEDVINRSLVVSRRKKQTNTDKHIIFVDSCANWCRGAANSTSEQKSPNASSLRSSTDLAKGGGCELGRPRLEEFNFDEELTKTGCKRVATDNTIKEKKVCEALAQVGLKTGSILTLWQKHAPHKKIYFVRIQGFEGEMVKLAPSRWAKNDEGRRARWAEGIYKILFPPPHSRLPPDSRKYGELGWHPRHKSLPTINIPYENIVAYKQKMEQGAERVEGVDPAIEAKKEKVKAELLAWRAEFERSQRRKPTRDDMFGDAEAAKLFARFQSYTEAGLGVEAGAETGAEAGAETGDPQPLVPSQIEALRPLEDETKLLGAKRDTLESLRTAHSFLPVVPPRLSSEYFRRGTKKHHLNLAAKLRSTRFGHGIRDSVPIEELAATHEAIADRIGKVKEAHVALSKSHPTLAWKHGWIGKKTRKYKNHDGTTQSLGYYHGKNITEDGTTPMKFKKGGRKTLKRKRKTRKRKTRKRKTRKGKTRKRKTRKRKTHRKKKISRRIMV